MKIDPELQAALDAIAAGPGDDGRKQVLADLLLERGDPRGEFMLLQFLLSANQASGAMRRQADELWRRHRQAWLAGVRPLLADVKLERGFPVEATLVPAAMPAAQLEQAVRSPMFCTLRRLRAKAGEAALVDLAAHPRMRALTELVLTRRADFEALASRGVPGRLRRLELTFGLDEPLAVLLATAPAFSSLSALSFRVSEPARRRAEAAPSPGLVPVLRALSGHAALEAVGVGGVHLGDRLRFLEVAAAWPSLRFRQLSAVGSFELARADDGTEVTLQNMTYETLARLRGALPPGTVRVRLMPDRRPDQPIDRDAMLAAYAGLDVKTLP
ncbi:MAG: hypothetical protein ACOZQL_42830 [Myxococcota bacterium]